MAQLGSYYGLCPLIDHRSLLGICEDVDQGTVVVTLDKNIAIKYKLSDQKQLHSWRTKDKFSSPIIYDKNEKKYYAVFNQTYIRIWSGDVDNIFSLKKHKFTSLIHTIFTYRNKSYIIFQNGMVSLLSQALENRKTLTCDDNIIDKETDFIADVLCGYLGDDVYVGLVINSNDKFSFVWHTFSNDMLNGFNKVNIERHGATLTGYACHSDSVQGDVKLITIWSDGRVYLYSLLQHNNTDLHYLKPPGELYSVIESVCCKQFITVASLSDDYLAIYGAAANDEGAILIIYNLSFRVVQSKLLFKMFSIGTKMWLIEDSYLLLCVGQNLAVVPFTLETEKVAALVSSHKVSLHETDPDVTIVQNLEVTSWDNKHVKKGSSSIPKCIEESVMNLTEQGWPEHLICDALITEYLESKNVECICSCLEYFAHISENCLAKILNFCLNADDNCFTGKKKQCSEFASILQPAGRCKLMNQILTKSFSDVQFLPHLHNELNIKNVIDMLNYIICSLSDKNLLYPLNAFETEGKLLHWGCVLLDANYQKFVFTKDEQTIEVLKRFKNTVDECLSCLQNLQQLSPLILEIIKKKTNYKPAASFNYRYCVEEFNLY